jgi:hypothetical protein
MLLRTMRRVLHAVFLFRRRRADTVISMDKKNPMTWAHFE